MKSWTCIKRPLFLLNGSTTCSKESQRLAEHNQLDRASTSIPLNIAEGNGKYTAADRCRFFDIARGSALECAACLDVLVSKKRIDSADSGKAILVRIVSMLVGLIRSTSPSRVYEDSADYGRDLENRL